MQLFHFLHEKKKVNITWDISVLLGIKQGYILEESHFLCTNKQLPKLNILPFSHAGDEFQQYAAISFSFLNLTKCH